MESLLAPTFNLLILVGFLVYKLRLPLKQFVQQRHQHLKDEILSVANQLKQAQEKYNEFASKLKSVDGEVSNLKDQTKQESLAIQQRVLADARRTATTVVSDSKRISEGLYSQLRGQLYAELCTQVLDRAASLLTERLTGDDRVRIQQEFSKQVERVQ